MRILSRQPDQPSQQIFQFSSGGIAGYIVVDSTVRGKSSGGLRMMEDISLETVSRLAHLMTLKHGFVGVPVGGAKAGLTVDENAPAGLREQALRAFAQNFSPILKSWLFTPGSDVGSIDEDIQSILRVIGRPLCRRRIREENGGVYTAYSLLVALKFLARMRNLSLTRSTVAVEGLGKVGTAMARLLESEGVTVRGVGTRNGFFASEQPSRATDLIAKLNSDDCYGMGLSQIRREEFLQLPVDILIICGIGDFLRAPDIPLLRCKIVISGANLPYTEDVERLLLRRGILCLPDFTTNCGGVAGKLMEFGGLSKQEIYDIIERRLTERYRELLPGGEESLFDVRNHAEQTAQENFNSLKSDMEHSFLKPLVLNAGLALYRRNFIPRFAARVLAQGYFSKTIFPAARRPHGARSIFSFSIFT